MMRRRLLLALPALMGGGLFLFSAGAAAAEPFADVPAGHWAYDAVARLAADGVVEGYGDGTYRGDVAITRYEMAQMVARAMARPGISGADKSLVDRLAAEFAEELGSLGVRVAALEKRVDNVVWRGRVRYRFISQHKADDGQRSRSYNVTYTGGGSHANLNQFLFRLEPEVRVNEHWRGRARISYYQDMDSARNVSAAVTDWLWAEGRYGKTLVNLGKFPYRTEGDYGLFLDDPIAGGQVIFGGAVKAALTAGRYNFNSDPSWYAAPASAMGPDYDAASYQGVEIFGDRSRRFTWGVAYHHLKAGRRYAESLLAGHSANLWSVGLGYRFSPQLSLNAAYLKNTSLRLKDAAAMPNVDVKRFGHAYNIELSYRGARPADVGSFGCFVAYRYLGQYTSLNSTYQVNGGMRQGDRGFEVGASYTFARNVVGHVRYFYGKRISPQTDAASPRRSSLFTELNFFF